MGLRLVSIVGSNRIDILSQTSERPKVRAGTVLAMSSLLTPTDLARELTEDPKRIRDLSKRIRAFLRKTYGKLPPHETRWQLTEAQEAPVRHRFHR